jgi:hypothetical protein
LSEEKTMRVSSAMPSRLLYGVEELTDFVVHVLDEGDVGGALFVEPGFALLHFLQPILRWLDRKVGGVVGEVEEEGFLFVGRLLLYVVDAPSGEYLGGVALGVYLILVATHPVDSAAEVGPVIVHHVGKKAVKEIEAAIVGYVGRLEAKMPLAYHSSVVACLAHEIGHGGT